MRHWYPLCFVLHLAVTLSHATHLRAVEITARPINCEQHVYEITVTAYLNYQGSSISFGGDQTLLDFGDGTTMSLPEMAGEIIDPVNFISRAIFRVSHSFPGAGTYTISYREFNRNEGILNMDGSVSTALYTQSQLLIEQGRCNTFPQLRIPPIDRGCSGKIFFHNVGATDDDDDSLSFALVIPMQNKDQDVFNFVRPDHSRFYTSRNYNQANESQDGTPTILIDPVSGLLTWDAPGAAGEYAIAIKVQEWRFNSTDGLWYPGNSVVRDMQIIIQGCSNQRPNLSTQENLCVIAGDPVEFTLRGSDPDHHPVIIEGFSDLFHLTVNPAEVFPSSPVAQSTAVPYDTAAIRFRWQTDCRHVRNQPHQVVFKITDQPSSDARLVRFVTVNIKVIAPAPVIENVSVNPVSKEVMLQWSVDGCDQTRAYQVWRRVAEYEYDQPECVNGMPVFLRYKLLGEVPADQTSYVDRNVAVGAQYCYRVVALVGNFGVPSRVSLDTCVIPKPAEAPVITNVSIVRTDHDEGHVALRWTRPFDIDQTQYPPPYSYRVARRAEGDQSGAFDFVSQVVTDTMFVDANLNTQKQPYQYYIELYVTALSNTPVDSSSRASSVFATAIGQADAISVTWRANTPWYNYLQKHPYHLIYRSSSISPETFELIDSVDVNENDFIYIDRGTFEHRTLDPSLTYYYKIMTRGGYGNPSILEPLVNFSQVTDGVVLDSSPPCPPVVAIDKENCEDLPCDPGRYLNRITWSSGSAECAEQGLSFIVYESENPEDEFKLLGAVVDPYYEHSGLESKVRCYRVISVDRGGNRSEPSDVVCADNCPYFMLPNVFTPGEPDGRNDVFKAFDENAHNTSWCARFVKEVSLKIFNRWGHQVHMTSLAADHLQAPLWDGYNAGGEPVAPGVYFYEAKVTFDVRDPAAKQRTFKGWVHVVPREGR